jgi:putative membrane protein
MTRDRALALYLIALFALLALSACSASEHSVQAAEETLYADEGAFAQEASQALVGEIHMGRQALQRSRNEEVKNYAAMLVDDRTDRLESLTRAMQENSIPQPGSPTPESLNETDQMAMLSGIEFDREFVNTMVANHKKDLESYKQMTVSLPAGSIRKHAEDRIPSLEMELQKAQELQSKLFHGDRP